jgi:hypothetical protein
MNPSSCMQPCVTSVEPSANVAAVLRCHDRVGAVSVVGRNCEVLSGSRDMQVMPFETCVRVDGAAGILARGSYTGDSKRHGNHASRLHDRSAGGYCRSESESLGVVCYPVHVRYWLPTGVRAGLAQNARMLTSNRADKGGAAAGGSVLGTCTEHGCCGS